MAQGSSPHELALTIALGLMIGTMPIIWGATLLCAAFAFYLGLNQAGIQVVNYLAYPLQIALFVPFHRLGARIFPRFPLAAGKDMADYAANVVVATFKAVGAWFLVAAPAAILLYFLLRLVFTRKKNARVLATVPAVAGNCAPTVD